MKAIDRVIEFLVKPNAKQLCDDCLAPAVSLSARQEANKISRRLIKSPAFKREKGVCDECGGYKYRLFAIGKSIPKQLPNSKINVSILKDIGFISIGYWQDDNGSPVLTLTDLQTASPALYAFVENGNVLYVGKTTQTLKKRLYFYQRPSPSQTTNIRINAHLAAALFDGREIDMYGYADARPIKVGMFDINLSAALEDSIIKTLNPLWNIR